jgi:hypothetical protein
MRLSEQFRRVIGNSESQNKLSEESLRKKKLEFSPQKGNQQHVIQKYRFEDH